MPLFNGLLGPELFPGMVPALRFAAPVGSTGIDQLAGAALAGLQGQMANLAGGNVSAALAGAGLEPVNVDGALGATYDVASIWLTSTAGPGPSGYSSFTDLIAGLSTTATFKVQTLDANYPNPRLSVFYDGSQYSQAPFVNVVGSAGVAQATVSGILKGSKLAVCLADVPATALYSFTIGTLAQQPAPGISVSSTNNKYLVVYETNPTAEIATHYWRRYQEPWNQYVQPVKLGRYARNIQAYSVCKGKLPSSVTTWTV